MISLEHYDSILGSPASRQASLENVSYFIQRPASLGKALDDGYGFSKSAKFYSNGEMGLALVQFFQS